MSVRRSLSERSSGGSVRIRRATHEDAALIASVLAESFREYRDLYTPEGFAATTPTSVQIRSRMEEGPVWVALLDGAVVGTVAAVDHGEDLYVRGMAVLPNGRGRGIGALLLRQIEDYASPRGYERLILSTTPFLYQAIQLYERYGFRRVEEGPHDLLGTPLFTMVKDVEQAGMG
jgi:ribosomal protein S18 acetylase RimI-like enzyme